MIDKAMNFILRGLNGYLGARHHADEDHVVLSSPTLVDGAPAEDLANKVILSLINIEREGVSANSSQQYRTEAGKSVRAKQPLNINLILLISANYENNYPDGLKMLSLVLQYFQAHPLFTRQTAADLPDPLERLAIEWRDLDLQSLHNLWSVLGGHYLPSAVYKARMLVLEDAWIGDDAPIITGTSVDI